MTINDNLIRVRAHELWEADGRPEGQGVDYWLRAEQELAHQGLEGFVQPSDAGTANSGSVNEGEGNRTAARKYNTETKKFAESGRVTKMAREAAIATDDPKQRREMTEAEAAGKAHSHGEDPALADTSLRSKN